MDKHVERARLRDFESLFRVQELEDALVAADEVVAPRVVVRVDGRVRVGVEVEVLERGEQEGGAEGEREKDGV